MSDISDVVNGLVTVLTANITGLHAFNHEPDVINEYPAAVVQIEEPIDIAVVFGGNTIEGDLRVTVLTASSVSEEATLAAYALMSPTGANVSLIAAVRADRTLNGSVDDAQVMTIETIGRRVINEAIFTGFDAVVHFIKSIA